jgi:hypothetical protein
VTIYIANRPDRATDGSFLTENVKEIDFLTDQELQTGAWLYESALNPGTWYLMARASAESSCYFVLLVPAARLQGSNRSCMRTRVFRCAHVDDPKAHPALHR